MGLDTVELIIATEKRFGIDISNREAAGLTTVGLLQAHVVDALRRRGSGEFRGGDPPAAQGADRGAGGREA